MKGERYCSNLTRSTLLEVVLCLVSSRIIDTTSISMILDTSAFSFLYCCKRNPKRYGIVLPIILSIPLLQSPSHLRMVDMDPSMWKYIHEKFQPGVRKFCPWRQVGWLLIQLDNEMRIYLLKNCLLHARSDELWYYSPSRYRYQYNSQATIMLLILI
jgi:hypothetical protein